MMIDWMTKEHRPHAWDQLPLLPPKCGVDGGQLMIQMTVIMQDQHQPKYIPASVT